MAKVDKEERTTKQERIVERDNSGKWQPGSAPNPDGKGGFIDNPENRSDGRWDKDTSISYWYNKLGRMSDVERAEFKPTTSFQRIALLRIERAERDNDKSLDEAREITDRTEGRAKQDIGLSADESIMPLIKGFVIPVLPDNIADIPDEEPDTSGE